MRARAQVLQGTNKADQFETEQAGDSKSCRQHAAENCGGVRQDAMQKQLEPCCDD
jgi:hypothetical protein